MLMQYAEDDAYNIPIAIGHLADLGYRMRSSNFGFKEQDVGNIDAIIEAINELETQRTVLHDQLEAESIKCSILRHELKFLPGQYRKEIHDAVVNARQSNSDLVKNLNKQLKEIEANIESLTLKHEQLEAQNSSLLPDRDKLRVQHEDVITVLNQRMAEKATKQIKLNETRDKLRGTHSKIMDLEDDLLQLKEDMIKERADARAEKARLRASINEAKEKKAAQDKDNEEAKSQLDHLVKRLEHTERELDEQRKFIYKAEIGKSKAEGLERALSSQINKQLRDNDELRKRILDIQRKKIETEQKYKADIEAMQKYVEQLKAQIKVKEQRQQRLNVRRDELVTEEEIVSEKRTSSAAQVTELNQIESSPTGGDVGKGGTTGRGGGVASGTSGKSPKDKPLSYSLSYVRKELDCLMEAKQALVRKQEEIARMREENTRMEQEIVELGDTHVVCVENFNRQIEEYREQLGKERKDRMDVQTKRDAVQKNLEEFKATNNRFMAGINKKVSQGKEKHDELTNEGGDLQAGLKQLDNKIKAARTLLRDERMNYELKKSEVEQKLAALRDEIARYEHQTKDGKELMEKRIPAFAQQTADFNEAQKEFEKLKKEVTEVGIEKIVIVCDPSNITTSSSLKNSYDSSSTASSTASTADVVGRTAGSMGRTADGIGKTTDDMGRSAEAIGRTADVIGTNADGMGRIADTIGMSADGRARTADSMGRTADVIHSTSDDEVNTSDDKASNDKVRALVSLPLDIAHTTEATQLIDSADPIRVDIQSRNVHSLPAQTSQVDSMDSTLHTQLSLRPPAKIPQDPKLAGKVSANCRLVNTYELGVVEGVDGIARSSEPVSVEVPEARAQTLQPHTSRLNAADTTMHTRISLNPLPKTPAQKMIVELGYEVADILGMKSQKASLEDQVKRTRLMIEKVIKPQSEYKKEINTLRGTLLQTMKIQLDEATELERQVYVVGTKLQTIADENQRFTESNEKMASDIELMEREKIACYDDIERLKAEYAFLKSLLVTAWGQDSALEKQMTERDLEILQKLADVLKLSSVRSNIVSGVSEGMNAELTSLSDFLDVVAERRPQVETETVDSAMNTRGDKLTDKASQPSEQFFIKQDQLDKLGVMFPLSRESRESMQKEIGSYGFESVSLVVREASSASLHLSSFTSSSKSSFGLGGGQSKEVRSHSTCTPSSHRKLSAKPYSPKIGKKKSAVPSKTAALNKKDPLPPIQPRGSIDSGKPSSGKAGRRTKGLVAPSDIDIDVDGS